MEPTYVFKQGKVLTVVNGKVVTSSDEDSFEEFLESKGKGSKDSDDSDDCDSDDKKISSGGKCQLCGKDCPAGSETCASCDSDEALIDQTIMDEQDGKKSSKTAGNGFIPEDNIFAMGPQGQSRVDSAQGGLLDGYPEIASQLRGGEIITVDGQGPFEVYDTDGEGTVLIAPADAPDESQAFQEDLYGKDVQKVGSRKQAGPPGQFMEPAPQPSSEDAGIDMPEIPDELQADLINDIADCPACGEATDPDDRFCSNCGEPLDDNETEASQSDDDIFGDEEMGLDDEKSFGARPLAKRVVTTPSGLEGTVMNRVAGLWGEEVTVRFSNGRVKKMPVTGDMKFSSTQEQGEASVVEGLRSRLAATVPGNMDSLNERQLELEQIQSDVRNYVAKASHDERVALHNISTEASYEAKEIADAIQHQRELQGRGFVPTASFGMHATEQASMGNSDDGGWLNEVVSSMDEESKATDYAKLMEEGPLTFIAGSDDATVANSGATRLAASRYIRSFTASAASTTTEAQRGQYERQFLTNVEQARKNELKTRKTATRKEASQVEKQASEAPDDSLFL